MKSENVRNFHPLGETILFLPHHWLTVLARNRCERTFCLGVGGGSAGGRGRGGGAGGVGGPVQWPDWAGRGRGRVRAGDTEANVALLQPYRLRIRSNMAGRRLEANVAAHRTG